MAFEIEHGKSVTTTAVTHTGDTAWYSAVSVAATNFVAGGKYLLVVSAEVVGTDATKAYGARLVHGATPTLFAGSDMVFEPVCVTPPYPVPYGFFTVWTQPAGGAEALYFQICNITTAGDTVTADSIEIFWMRLDDLVIDRDYVYNENTSSTGLTASWADFASITFTPATASQDWLVLANPYYSCSDEVTGASFRINRDADTEVAPLFASEPEDATDTLTWLLHRAYTLTAASHTFKIQGCNSSGSTQHTHVSSRIFALRLHAFLDHGFFWNAAKLTPTYTDYGAFTSVDATHLYDTTKSWTPDALIGKAVVATPYSMVITDNDATSVTGAGWDGGTPAIGDYIICDWNEVANVDITPSIAADFLMLVSTPWHPHNAGGAKQRLQIGGVTTPTGHDDWATDYYDAVGDSLAISQIVVATLPASAQDIDVDCHPERYSSGTAFGWQDRSLVVFSMQLATPEAAQIWRVAASGDDARCYDNWPTPIHSFSATGTSLQVGYIATTNEGAGSGFRFTGIVIPPGATITDSHLTVICRTANALTGVHSQLYCEHVADATGFGADDSTTFHAKAANPTTKVAWDDIETFVVGGEYTSPDISVCIQEIIDHAGWVGDATSDINVFWEDWDLRSDAVANTIRIIQTYDAYPMLAAKLHIEYSVNVSVSAVAATATAAAPLPAAAGISNPTISAVLAAAASAAPFPAITAIRNVAVSAIAAVVTAAAVAIAGVSVGLGAALSGAVASAPTPIPSVSVSVPAATATATAPLPGMSVSVPVPAAAAIASAPLPAVAAVQSRSVSAVVATAGSSALLPAMSASVGVAAATSTTAALLPGMSTSASAAVASATATAPLPSVGAIKSPTVSPPTAIATATAPLPGVAAIKNPTVSAARAIATATAPIPAVVGTVGAGVVAVPATATASARIPTGGASVSVARAIAVAAGLVPTTKVSVTVTAATATSVSPLPGVAAIKNPTVAATVAAAVASAPIPAVSLGTTVSVSAVPATASVSALLPTVTGTAVVAAVPASALAVAQPPTASTSVAVALATATSTCPLPTVAGIGNPTVAAIEAVALAVAHGPAISAGGSVQTLADIAVATAEAPAPSVSATRSPSVAAVAAASAAAAQIPVVTATGTVAALTAQATAEAAPPVVSTGASPVVQAVIPTAAAAALVPTVAAVQNPIVLPPCAIASAVAPVPAVLGTTTAAVAGIAATSAAAIPLPTVTAIMGSEIGAVATTGSASALAPAVSAICNPSVAAVPATAVAAAGSPTISGGGLPEIISLTGSYDDIVSLTGSYEPQIELEGAMGHKQNLEMFRGEDKILEVTVTGESIGGWTLMFTLRQTAGSTAALLERAGVITSAVGGIFQITLTDEDTVGLAPGKYAYDCKRTNAGAEGIIVYGTLTLLAEVTR